MLNFRCTPNRLQGRGVISFLVPLALDNLLYSSWYSFVRNWVTFNEQYPHMAGWTDRSPESSRSDTFSNSSENQTAHSKPISFQILHLLKREEVAYYPAGNDTGGNAFSFCYQSLMPLAYL